jgi:hypothetical protein
MTVMNMKMKVPGMNMKMKVPGMNMKMKVPGMNMKMKVPGMNMKIKVPSMIRAGCGTLMFKSCFSRRRVTPEPPLERKPSWSKWRKTRLLHCTKDATTRIPA